MAKRRSRRLQQWTQSAGVVLLSAYFWYVLLAMFGAVVTALGVGLEYGVGHGLIAFGVCSLIGSEIIRKGMTRA